MRAAVALSPPPALTEEISMNRDHNALVYRGETYELSWPVGQILEGMLVQFDIAAMNGPGPLDDTAENALIVCGEQYSTSEQHALVLLGRTAEWQINNGEGPILLDKPCGTATPRLVAA